MEREEGMTVEEFKILKKLMANTVENVMTQEKIDQEKIRAVMERLNEILEIKC